MGTVSGAASDVRFIGETGMAAELAALVEPALQDLGFRLVRVAVSARNGTTVQVMAERPDGTITVADCALISRQLSALFDAHDPITGSYTLEVSSPGIDRLLARRSDFVVWAGYEAKIELKHALDGRKRFRGVLAGLQGDDVQLEAELDAEGRKRIALPVSMIGEARLVLTDELVREALRRAKKAGTDTATEKAAE
jgi:ribosome maturation factor RimP